MQVNNPNPSVTLMDEDDAAAFATALAAGTVPRGTIYVVGDTGQMGVVTAAPGNTTVQLSMGDVVGETGEDLSAGQYLAVTYDATGRFVKPGLGEPFVGILQNAPLAALGSLAVVRTVGPTLAKFGGVVTAGARIAALANGKLKVAEDAVVDGTDVGGSWAGGWALEDGADTENKRVLLKALGAVPAAPA